MSEVVVHEKKRVEAGVGEGKGGTMETMEDGRAC
jgi:hypothetical protein